jgi:hypothetical protein
MVPWQPSSYTAASKALYIKFHIVLCRHLLYINLTTYFLIILHSVQDFKILLFRNCYLRFYTRLFSVLADDDPTGTQTCRSFQYFSVIGQ